MHIPEIDVGIINVDNQAVIRLGRDAENNDHVLPHPAVSSRHARLELRPDGQWWVLDLDSDHGTYVNNRRVGAEGLPVRMQDDTLWIAPYALRLSQTEGDLAPKPAHLRLDAVNLVRQVGERILLDLRGTPLSFRPGEFIAVVGGSGAGKSTLLKALLGMDTIPEKGRTGDVYFNNQRMVAGARVYSFAPLNTIVGYVPQQDDSLHFHLTAREALDFSAKLRFAADVSDREREERVIEALSLVCLDREELQTRPISQLSGGQRKRVNVAMELVAEPRLLFLDEPTSGLDPGLDLEMMALMRNWAQGEASQDPKTIVLITHATENVRLCDYVVFMGRVRDGEEQRGGCVIYFGPPEERCWQFFGKGTFSEIYQVSASPDEAGYCHAQLLHEPEWNRALWEHGRTPQDIQESKVLADVVGDVERERFSLDWKQTRRKFGILARRYFLLLRRDGGAFLFQLLQGALVALLLWGVASADTFTTAGIQSAPTTLFILSIAATWLGILNASKEIVKEKRVYGRERRYGVDAISYILSKFSVLGALGIWQMVTLIVVMLLRFEPESYIGAFGRALPDALQIFAPLPVEWFITLELMLLAGIASGLFISAFARSLDQATMFMFPVMLIQILLAGLLFDVGPFAWLSITHWGIQALGNSLDLEALFFSAGLAGDPTLDKLNFAGSGLMLLGYWLVLALFSVLLVGLTFWRQSWKDKARIPED